MKKFLVAALLTTFTLNAFSDSEGCLNLVDDLKTEIGDFHLTNYENLSAVEFRNKKIELTYVAGEKSANAGGMKLDKHGEYVDAIWPVHWKPLAKGFETFDYILSKGEDFASIIRRDKYHERMINKISVSVMFSSEFQPMYVKGIGKKLLKKLNEVEINESNALFISCAQEALQNNISLID